MQSIAPPGAGGRPWRLYERLVLLNPRRSLFILAAISAFLGFWLKDFRIDSSRDAIVLEHDEDVQYFRAMSARYESRAFIVVTYSPREDLFSPAALERLKRIRDELKELEWASSVVTILDVPLLQNPPGTLKDLARRIKTLESPQVDLPYAVEELRQSPIYQNLLVGKDMKSTAIQVNIRVEKSDQEMMARRAQLREKKYRKSISRAERAELKTLEKRYRRYKDAARPRLHHDIQTIREITAKYSGQARFRMGGIPMIVDSVVSFTRGDLIWFGLGMLVFVVAALYSTYRQMRWVILPVAACVISVLVTMGLMGLCGWEVTVASSNFASLQMILAMSLAIHIVSHYRELLWERPDASNVALVLATARETFVPSFYTTLAIIAGFDSLILCDIMPVVQFGWIMTLGLTISLIIVYWFLPAAMILLPRPPHQEEPQTRSPITQYLADFTHQRRPLIYAASLTVALATAAGMRRLDVANSFIDSFRRSTEVYQGMKFIDDEFGGTTPLDIVLTLPPEKTARAASAPAAKDKDFEAFGEFDDKEEDSSKYWYTASRMETIEKAHDYLERLPETGKVLSLATLNKMGKSLNQGRPFDDLGLALLYNTVSDKFKDILIAPYVSIENNEARITARIRDTMPSLRRAELIRRIRRGLVSEAGLREDQFRVSGQMLLYSNMLESLAGSQLKIIATSLAALLVIFLLLFRSLEIALVALLPQALACLSILGLMGLAAIPLDVMTITIVSVALGIGVGNAIHYLHHFQIKVAENHDYPYTMYRCHQTIGNSIFYSSAAVAGGFSILVFSKFIPTVMFGLLTGVAMAVACASGLTLLPALILLVEPFGPIKRWDRLLTPGPIGVKLWVMKRHVGAGVAILAAIAALDTLLGSEIGSDTFYLLPVLYVSWFAGFSPAVPMAAASALAWLIVDTRLLHHVYANPAAPYCNALIDLALFAGAALLVARLRESLARERELSGLKSDLLTLASQELGNSVMIMASGHAIIKKKLAGPGQREADDLLGMLEKAQLSLKNTIENLLDHARIESGRFNLEMGEVDLKKLIEGYVRLAEPLISQASLNVRLQCEVNSTVARGDPNALSLIISNLILNAIKRTLPLGGITITLKAAGPKLELSVADEGIGIPDDDLSGTPPAGEGVGIGLKLSRQLLESHASQLVVESQPGRGSRFSFQLEFWRAGTAGPANA